MQFSRSGLNWWFWAFMVSVVLCFFYMRPLNSSGSPFIAGDGLGYYSFLPAQFIYADPTLEFKWFTKAHNDNYSYSAFPDPEDNLLVKYHGRKINKMYPGLSFLWMPFFFLGHLFAFLFGYARDGFSFPYQLCIGLASIVYLLLGLLMLRKLVFAFTKNQFASVIVPILFFYGTYLFEYGLLGNSMSHIYSFALLNVFLFFAWRFFDGHDKRLTSLLLAALAYALAVTVRPLTGLILCVIPALIPAGYNWKSVFRARFRGIDRALLALIIFSLAYTVRILYVQTGNVFAYTYTNERFDFAHARFFEVLFSYHLGIFLYAPLLCVSLFGIFFMRPGKLGLIPALFVGVIFLYSAWWYWPIAKRSLVDFYQLPAIGLGYLVVGKDGPVVSRLWLVFRRTGIVFAVLATLYFQLKNYQFRNGILDQSNTYGEVFRKNFFKLRRSSQYPVNPDHILKKEEFTEGFEGMFPGNITAAKQSAGEKSLLLDSLHYISKVGEYGVPAFFGERGFAKFRCSFDMYAEEGLGSMQAIIKIQDTLGRGVMEVPLYLSPPDYRPRHWERREFGYELPKEMKENYRAIGPVSVLIWNVEPKGAVFIDEVKFEFILTSESLETIE